MIKMGKTKSIVKDASLLTLSKIVSMTMSMLSAMLLSRFRSLQEFGTYSQINLVVYLAVSVIMLGLPNSLNYFLPRADNQEEQDLFLSTYLSLGSLLALTAGAVLLLGLPLIVGFFKNPDISAFTYVLALLPWTRVFISSNSNLLVASGQTRRLIVYSIAISAVQLLIILATQWSQQGFAFYMVLYVASEAAFAMMTYHEFTRLMKKKHFSIRWAQVRPILAFTIPLGLAYAVGTLNAELDKAMIGYFLGTEALAIYANAGRELPVSIIGSSLVAVLMPVLARLLKDKKADEAVELWKNSVELSMIFTVFFVSSFIVFAPQLILLLYGDKYLPGVSIFRVYVLVLLWRVTYFGIILNVSGNSKMILYSSVASLLLNIVLNYLCFLVFGMIGPAIATFISLGVMQLFQLWYSSKILNVSFSKVFPWRSLLNLIFIGTVFTVLGLYAVSSIQLSFDRNDYLIAALSSMIWLVAYYIICKSRIHRLRQSMNI